MLEIEHIRFEKIPSTNTWAKQNAHKLSQTKLTVITAEEQTAGRGRFKRVWHSPPKQSIYASFCFFLEIDRYPIGNIPQILAIAATEVLEELGFHCKLKWPNDLMIKNNKIGGILCETTLVEKTLCVIVGIGLNVNMPKEELKKIDRPATSLYAEQGITFDVEMIETLLIQRFSNHLLVFKEKGFAPFLILYKQLMIHNQGDPIHFQDGEQHWNGTFHSINSDGSINLKLDSGEIKRLFSGEIIP